MTSEPRRIRIRLGGDGSLRFDHVVVAVRALEPAVAALRAAGFEVDYGGRHPGHGTHNAIVVLDRGYLELIAREDPAAPATSPLAADVAQLVRSEGGGLAGWALALDGSEAALTAIAAGTADGALPPGCAMSRALGDELLRWELRFIGRDGFLGPYPFFIHWYDAPPHQRMRVRHPNGVTAVSELELLVSDQRVTDWYERGLRPALDADVSVTADVHGAPAPTHGGRLVAVTLCASEPVRPLTLDPRIFGSTALSVVPDVSQTLDLPGDQACPRRR